MQKTAHQELSQKHSSQEKQLKDLSESLDNSRFTYKELYDISQKLLDFNKDLLADLGKCLNKPYYSKSSKENLHLSLVSNHTQLNNSLLLDFNSIKDDVKGFLTELCERYKQEAKNNSENKLQIANLIQDYDRKTRDLQRKIESFEEETGLKTEKNTIELRRTFAREIDELKTSFKISEARKNKEIEELKEKYEKEIRFLSDEKNYALENLSYSIKNSHKQELKELELSFKAKESELLEELDLAANTDSSVLASLRENLEKMQIKVQDLREVLRAITERCCSLYQKYAYKEDLDAEFIARKEEISRISDNKAWQQYSELLTQLDFMSLSFKKITADNEWLVEQIDELTKETANKNKFGKELSYDQVLTTLSANEMVIKDFQDARTKLLKQFAEAKRG